MTQDAGVKCVDTIKARKYRKMKSYKRGQPCRSYIFNRQKYNWYLLDFFMSSSSFQQEICHRDVCKLSTKYALLYMHKFLLYQKELYVKSV